MHLAYHLQTKFYQPKMDRAITRVIFTGLDHNPTWVFDKVTDSPKVRENQVLLRIRLATICGSDMHTILGKICIIQSAANSIIRKHSNKLHNSHFTTVRRWS